MELSMSVQPDLIGQATERSIDIHGVVNAALTQAVQAGGTTPTTGMPPGTTHIRVEVPEELVRQAKALGVKIGQCVDAGLIAALHGQTIASASRDFLDEGRRSSGRLQRRGR